MTINKPLEHWDQRDYPSPNLAVAKGGQGGNRNNKKTSIEIRGRFFLDFDENMIWFLIPLDCADEWRQYKFNRGGRPCPDFVKRLEGLCLGEAEDIRNITFENVEMNEKARDLQ